MEHLVEQTEQYDLFKKHKSNRHTNEKLVKKLMVSLKDKNLLKSKPVLVDKHYNVIDGQHRLEAAKRLNLPISYVVDEEVDFFDMEKLNANTQPWGLGDYLNFHVNNDNLEYALLLDFMEKNDLKLNIAIQLLHSTRDPKFFESFKKGTYKYPSPVEENEAIIKKTQIQEVINYIRTKTSGPKTYLEKVTFYSSMVEFFNIKSFVYDIFMKKLQYKIDFIHPCTRQCDYLKIFRDIYNWKNHSPID